MFQITGAFAEFERSMIRTRVRAGLKRAKDEIKRNGHFVRRNGEMRRRLGCPGAEPSKLRKAQAELAKVLASSCCQTTAVFGFAPGALNASHRRDQPVTNGSSE
jgi:DNA invertase Pin-like site-specific DNA recombinase